MTAPHPDKIPIPFFDGTVKIEKLTNRATAAALRSVWDHCVQVEKTINPAFIALSETEVTFTSTYANEHESLLRVYVRSVEAFANAVDEADSAVRRIGLAPLLD